MKQHINYKKNNYYTDIKNKYINFSKKEAREIIWDHYVNNDIPTTFAKKKQEIENLEQFQDETYQLFSYLMVKHNEFKNLVNINDSYELFEYMSPGRDKPINMITWDKCSLATMCCGCAPTEQQFNSSTYNQIITSLINIKIVPLLYLIIKEINKYGNFIIFKGVKEDRSGPKVFYIHTLSIRPEPGPNLSNSHILNKNENENIDILKRRLEELNNETIDNNEKLRLLDIEYNIILEKIKATKSS